MRMLVPINPFRAIKEGVLPMEQQWGHASVTKSLDQLLIEEAGSALD